MKLSFKYEAYRSNSWPCFTLLFEVDPRDRIAHNAVMMKIQADWIRRLGPGLITTAVVLGPGSIVASSRAGAEAEYRLVWLLALACLLMATFTAMGARLGCALDTTPLNYIARRWGRAPAFVTGLSAFLVAAGFQFGNNIGVSVAFQGIFGGPLWIWPPLFTLLSLAFLIGARHVYQMLERMMMFLVGIMLIAFVANLFWSGFSPVRLAAGFVPGRLEGSEFTTGRAMLGTNFSAVAAFYQIYLVRAKGWRREDIGMAIRDARIGIAMLGLIALVIMVNAAAALHGSEGEVNNVGQLATMLGAILGPWATLIFCFGLAAASFSSFLANAMVGGTMMADGLGQNSETGGKPVKMWSAVVMLLGSGVAVGIFLLDRGSFTSLLIAQSATLVAAPLCALWIYGLSSNGTIMGDLKNRPVALVIGAIGLGVMFWLNFSLLQRLLGG